VQSESRNCTLSTLVGKQRSEPSLAIAGAQKSFFSSSQIWTGSGESGESVRRVPLRGSTGGPPSRIVGATSAGVVDDASVGVPGDPASLDGVGRGPSLVPF
jgi:hypothetical protein